MKALCLGGHRRISTRLPAFFYVHAWGEGVVVVVAVGGGVSSLSGIEVDTRFQVDREWGLWSLRGLTRMLDIDAHIRRICLIKKGERGYPRSVLSRFTHLIGAEGLHILERSPHREEGVLSDMACEKVVPEADVAVITGSALANGTLDRLLELAVDARTVAIVGPTASCLPEPLFSRGVDYLGGIRIRDADRAMRILSEGGGTPQLRQAGEFVTFKAG